jgi:hypothetical protein
MISTLLPTLAAAKPAGGAAVDQILIANAMAISASAALLWLVLGHRSGRRTHLARAAAFAERRAGLPGWVALPAAIAMTSLLVALLGMYWDISLHIDIGRDPGPLANPAHYLILAGLFGIFCAGFIAVALPRERPSQTAVRINRGWYAPLGGVLISVCAGFALLGFPLDDIWHRLFGQDVTLWGPTHLMLFGGASLSLVGMAVLLVEGIRARPQGEDEQTSRALPYLRRASLMGGLLIGLSTFQGEFDFGVPQFQLIFQPMLIALAAGVALVCARVWIGRGGALGAAAFFLLVRGAVSLLVGPVFGETTPALPLYVVEAGCVELAALWLVEWPLALGAVSGIAIGTIGFATEYGWANLVMRVPWNAHLLPEGPMIATIAGVAGGLAGGLMGTALGGELPSPRLTRAAALASLVAVFGLVADGLMTTVPKGFGADVKLTEVRPSTDRAVSARVRIHPASAAADAKWLNVTSWQGGGLVVNRLQRVGHGVYRSTEPIPVNGDWKTTVRLQTGRSVLGLPLYFPADPAIPAPKVAAPAHFDRSFVNDKQLLQREQKKGVPGWLTTVAPLVVLAIALGLLSVLAFGLARIGRTAPANGASRIPQPRWKRGRLPRTTPAA